MSDDAVYLLDLLERQYLCYKTALHQKPLRHDSFDRLSYGAWAISETIDAIKSFVSCGSYVSVGTVREILKEQISFYENYYNADKERQMRFKHALDTSEYFYKITGGFVYDE